MNSFPPIVGEQLPKNSIPRIEDLLKQDRTLIANTLLAEAEGMKKIFLPTDGERRRDVKNEYNQACADFKQMITRVLKENE